MFIVSKPSDIPCSEAKLVEPHAMPPLRPELLPRPYGWQVFQEQQDPNNPYNLIDAARKVRGEEPVPEAVEEHAAVPPPQQDDRVTPDPAPLPPVSAPAPARLALSPEEKRDLALIVELAQQRAPASFERRGGSSPVVVRLAHSRAFEARLHEFLARRGGGAAGSVVLFTAAASEPSSFHAQFTFAQGHTAFHPEADDPAQFGLIDGRLGGLAAGESVLGYVVLPPLIDVSEPMDVYWNDRRLAATLRP
jgi:hypothetical protein